MPRTQEWLVNEINKDTGMRVDSAYVSKILTGQRSSTRVVSSICKILNITTAQQQAQPEWKKKARKAGGRKEIRDEAIF